ncbi:MAG: transposase [Steroidobacteraceae bacterium]|nr:transposase [Steroidobacteraceae bacterium]
MPRRLRIHVTGGVYHVTLRGNHRDAIFFQFSDRSLLELIVERALQRFDARLHAYCWMTNHLHFVMQAGTEPIARPMHNIAAEFARAMQIKLETTGHFFERRYHATLVDTDSYMLELLRYVHLNPVEAGLAESVGAYHWSSHHNYIGARADPWVTTDFGLSMFSAERGKAVAAYQKFVDADQEKRWEPAQVIAPGVAILGGDDFVARHNRSAPRAVSKQSLSDLIDEAVRRFGVERVILSSPRRDAFVVQVRAWIGHQAAKRGIATLAAVARELGRTEGALRYALRAYPEEVW